MLLNLKTIYPYITVLTYNCCFYKNWFVSPKEPARKLVFLLITLLTATGLSAQVKGVVVDSTNNKPIDRAVVGLIIEASKTDTTYTLTDEKGEFVFETAPATNFSVRVSNIGYKSSGKFRRIYGSEKKIDMGKIILVNQSIILDEIKIQSSPIAIKEDTIEYRADAFKVKENGMVEDLLKKLPGVQVDKNGNIKAQGKAITKVKVNGKDFFGGNPKTATKELPANIVDKIQIVDDYGDQAAVSGIKEGDPEKVMNIQLKKDKNTGYFGRLTAGVGDHERYQASVNGNYFKEKQQISFFANSNNTSQSAFGGGGNKGMGSMSQNNINTAAIGSQANGPGMGDLQLQSGNGNDGITTSNTFGFNYRDDWGKRISVYGSYTYNHRNNSGYKISAQQNVFSSGTFFNNQNNRFENLGDNHRFFLNIEYNIDSFNYLKVSPSFSSNTNFGNNEMLFDFATVNAKTSEGNYNTIIRSDNPNFTGAILFNHKFRKRGRNFSLNINAGTSENSSDQDSRNHTILYNPAGTTDLILFNTQQNDNLNYGIRATYTEPISRTRVVDVALSHNFSKANNNKAVYNIDVPTGVRVFNPGLSNEYENVFLSDRANVSIRTTEKKYNYTVGISVQPVNLRGLSITKDSAYCPIKKINIFPVARVSYNLSRTQSLSANYRGDAIQPGFTQLQDIIDSSNLQYRTRGNPNLKPSINHSVNIFYNKFNFTNGKTLFTSLTFTTIQNQIINNTNRIGTSGAQITMPENVNGYYNISGFYNFSKPYNKRRYVISINGLLNYNHNINMADNQKNIGKNWVIGQGLNLEYNKDWLEVTAGANYNLNSISYTNAGSGSSSLQNDQYSSWSVNHNTTITLPKSWIFRYDIEYTVNKGLTGLVGKNLAIINASLEKQMLKNKNGFFRLQAFDLLNQSSNISRSVSSISIIDSRSNRLARYFMLTFTYRLQKFAGRQTHSK